MKKFVFRVAAWGLVSVILCLSFSAPIAARNQTGNSYRTSSTLDEHPWDILKRAVRIEVLSITDDIVILLVWFDLEKPPVIIQIDRKIYEGGVYSSKRLITRILSIFLE